MDQQDQVKALREALAEAYAAARSAGCYGHVFRGADGELVACVFEPCRGQQRDGWIIVKPDGTIQDGRTRAVLGYMEEIAA